MGLPEEISSQRSLIKTDSYEMSVGEIANLYRDQELDVHPEFQRVFRWSDTQKTKLIESILLGIPMPPVFVAQRPDGVWDLVDGVQRLSTILQFMGILQDDSRQRLPPLVLQGTKFLPSLRGKTWSGPDGLDSQLQLFIKRARIHVNIVLQESDQKSKYELFMRLNTGGSVLSGQEVRNCLMLMAYPQTYRWISELSHYNSFVYSTSLSDRLLDEKFDMELVTRFLAFRSMPVAQLTGIGDIGTYLDDFVETLEGYSEDKRRKETDDFQNTFDLIYSQIGENSFRKYDFAGNRLVGGFSIASFEAVAMGLGHNLNDTTRIFAVSNLLDKVKALWANEEFLNCSGSGVRASTRIPRVVPLARVLFQNG